MGEAGMVLGFSIHKSIYVCVTYLIIHLGIPYLDTDLYQMK